ncbi:polysaccharide pyruvyl transferase family protein [soil metagenome]
MPVKIVVINIVSLNPGDAAILQGSLEILRSAFGSDLQVTVFDRDGAAAARYYPWAEFRPSFFDLRDRGGMTQLAERKGWTHHLYRAERARLHAAGTLLARGLPGPARLFASARECAALATWLDADLIISNGGTYLVPHYNLLRPILNCELALSLRRPLVFFPQSLGPFDSTPYRDRLRHLFCRAARIVVRDELSAEHLRALQIPEELIGLSADAAFALARPAGTWSSRSGGERPRVAVSVREWAHYRNGSGGGEQEGYLAGIAAAVTHLVRRHGADVTFLSTCQGMPEYWIDDSVCARQIAGRLPPDVAPHVRVDAAFRDPRELMGELAAYDAIIATRMHAAILALCAGLPVLPVAYEFKTRELFRALQLEEWVTDIENVEPASFVARVDEFMARIETLRNTARHGTAERHARTRELAAALRELVPG